MDLIVVDDASQKKPSRKGMGPLVAAGGVHVPGGQVLSLEKALAQHCHEVGFPANQEFKWSPGRKEWMWGNLVDEDRGAFFRGCFDLAAEAEITAFVMIEDKKRGKAMESSASHEEDAVKLLLERGNNLLREGGREAMVLADRPGGKRKDENRFVAGCLETLRDGTDFVTFDRIGLLVTGDSRHSRLIQLADLITSCTLSYVAGQVEHHTTLFKERVMPLLRTSGGRTGGFGLKIQPDLRYGNLYHWLLGDNWIPHVDLPTRGRAYADSPDEP